MGSEAQVTAVEVPPTPTTDAEFEELPRLNLAEFRPSTGLPWFVVDHPADQLGTGGLTAYHDRVTAEKAAGSLPVLVLLPVEALDLVEAARAWHGEHTLDHEIELRSAVLAMPEVTR